MNLDRITNPLRLAKGPHQPGTGAGCAMNVISYINGDSKITDYPACSARPLAAFVQSCNDLLAGPGGYLTPENSIIALDLGWQTVGTAGVSRRVVHAWVAELLTSPTWGSSDTPKSPQSRRSPISPNCTGALRTALGRHSPVGVPRTTLRWAKPVPSSPRRIPPGSMPCRRHTSRPSLSKIAAKRHWTPSPAAPCAPTCSVPELTRRSDTPWSPPRRSSHGAVWPGYPNPSGQHGISSQAPKRDGMIVPDALPAGRHDAPARRSTAQATAFRTKPLRAHPRYGWLRVGDVADPAD
ncbi:putative gp51 [Mycobacterium kansasii 824]|nr:putative gp51 [Mycobacterium kansasii 824]